jgi:hypothetical protein
MKLKRLPQFTFCFVCTLVTAALALAMVAMHGVSAA